MIYEVHWKPDQGRVRSPSMFATWDAKVVDASPALAWTIGRHFEAVRMKLIESYNARVKIVPQSHMRKTIHGILGSQN